MYKTVAIFRIGQLGDTITAIPAISAIRENYTTARIILVTDKHSDHRFVSSWSILSPTGHFSEVLFFTPSLHWTMQLSRMLYIAWRLRRLKTEVLFYLAPFPRHEHQVKRDHIFFRTLCGIQEIYGLEPTSHLFGRRSIDGRLAPIPSETDRLLAIVQSAHCSVPAPEKVRFAIPITETERVTIDNRWKQEKALAYGGPVVAIGPGSKMPAKRWPLYRFIEVGRRVLDNAPGTRFIVLGGAEDFEMGSQIAFALDQVAVNWAGSLTILESAEALRRCALFLGNDTGLMHLAAAGGTRCVAIFSARDHPGKWYPYGDGHTVFRKHVPCEGCLLVECTQHGMACMNEISTEEVYFACQTVLGCLQH